MSHRAAEVSSPRGATPFYVDVAHALMRAAPALLPAKRSDHHARHVHHRPVPLDDHDSAVGDMVKLPVPVEVEAYCRVLRHSDVLVENRPPDSGASPDIAIVENDGILDVSSRVHLHPATEYGAAHRSPR